MSLVEWLILSWKKQGGWGGSIFTENSVDSTTSNLREVKNKSLVYPVAGFTG